MEWLDIMVFSWRDAVDIALVTFLLYWIFLLIKGTRVFSAFIGLAALLVVYMVAQFLRFYTLIWLLEALFGSLFLVIVILFHEDIRQGLSALGARYFGRNRTKKESYVEDVIWVTQYFAKRKTGALIVIEGGVMLGDMMHGGVMLDAIVSRELLLTIFFHNTPLHDGAVIIRNGRIAAAGCILPLAKVDRQHFGTRHRAALGVTDVSDAVVLVVSEERGEVSIAHKGTLAVMPNADQLRETLHHVLAL